MTEYRCQHPHPQWPDRRCNRYLGRGDFQGEIVVPCDRCHKETVLDGREAYTAAQVDKVATRVYA